MLGNQSLPASSMITDPSPTKAVNDRAKDKSIEGKSTDGKRKYRVIEDLGNVRLTTFVFENAPQPTYSRVEAVSKSTTRKRVHSKKGDLQSVQYSVESRSIQDSTLENNSVQSIELNKETQIESSEDPCVTKMQICPI
jgi:hypothetical protein